MTKRVYRSRTRLQPPAGPSANASRRTGGERGEASHLPLWKWFLAVYVVGESKKGISANQLKRMLTVSYKTAWYLCHRIRAAIVDAGQSSK
jgi:hypothetical protein